MLSAIVAVSQNGTIGRDGDLPWHLPADLKRFKALTMGHTIVMGRKTWDSIGRPLPGRRSVVLSRNAELRIDGATIVHSIDDALSVAGDDDELFIIGGDALFRLALERCDRFYVTLVHADVDGDVSFPLAELDDWRLTADEHHHADEKHAHAYSFRVYERRILSDGPIS